MRPLDTAAQTLCWHCGNAIDFAAGEPAARYLYRGDAPRTVVVEDWMRCACGAYQNARRLNEISVEALGSSV